MFLLPGSSEDALVGLINQQNSLSVPLEAGDLYYGHVKLNSDGSITLPTVTMYDNENYEGYATFNYKRINLSQVFSDQRPVIQDLGQTTLHRLLPIINKRLGINLTERDIQDQNIDWIGGNEKANLVIKATVESLGYEGNFVIQFTRIRPLLSTSIAIKSLAVLSHPNPLDQGKLSMQMATWGVNFTDYIQSLTLANQTWVNPAKIVSMMADNGFPGFVAAGATKVVQFATKDVPSANQAFTNVIIQPIAESTGFKGVAYIHFNRS